MNQEDKKTELPEKLVVTDDFGIGLEDAARATKVLMSPSDCYLECKDGLYVSGDGVKINLKEIIRALVDRYNRLVPRMELWQMLHKIQRKRSEGGILYEMIAQREWDQNGGTKTQKEFRAWMNDINKRFPLPPRAEWYTCNEKDKHFIWAATPPGEDSRKGCDIEAAPPGPVDPPRPKGRAHAVA